MNIRERGDILEILAEISDLRLVMSHLNSRLSHCAENLIGTYAELGTALCSVTTAVSKVETLIKRLVDEADRACERPQFSEDETKRLQHLNQVMNVISRFIHQRSEAISPGMEAKLADDSDPLCDFEIEAKIDYQLRDDDPDFDENGDNYLSSRCESLRRDSGSPKILEDCLRIGTVFLDIQVWWQYAFDVDSGNWLKRWRRPGGMPEYAKAPPANT